MKKGKDRGIRGRREGGKRGNKRGGTFKAEYFPNVVFCGILIFPNDIHCKNVFLRRILKCPFYVLYICFK